MNVMFIKHIDAGIYLIFAILQAHIRQAQQMERVHIIVNERESLFLLHS